MQPSIIQKQGFVWLALPRESVLPLMLLEKSHENILQRININFFGAKESAETLSADIFSLFPKPNKGVMPYVGNPKIASFFKGNDVLDIKSNTDITKKIPLLGEISATSKLKIASKLLYSFIDVKHIAVDNEVLLEEHLNISKPTTKAYGFLDKLRDGNLYVVTDVLQSTGFNVHDASDFTFDSNFNVEAVQKYINLKAQVQARQDSDQELSYRGQEPVTIALRASKIIFDNENKYYTLTKNPLKIVRGDFKTERDVLKSSTGIIDIE